MDLDEVHERGERVLDEVSRSVVADRAVLRRVLTGVLSGEHVLLEDVPGTGKTLTARSFATALGLSFSRIQFTPDLLPSDVTGTYVFDDREGSFEVNEGPLFANVVLADEITRASPKTRAALLEAMTERQVTVDGETHPLPSPFFVVATQNPVGRGEGTFSLPEAQKDRFLIKDSLGYPDKAAERKLLNRRDARDTSTPSVSRVLSADVLNEMQQATETVYVEDGIKEYIVDIVHKTRSDPRVAVGVSPYGCQRLFEGVRATAAIYGRSFVVPDDVKAIAHETLAHRLVPTAEAKVENIDRCQIVDDVLAEVSVPTVSRGGRA
ncbi:AAA family ATPase [Halobellus salinisoli]|uniref:AAA family ATPase n=1 Tax=Halobellus salinisoli TaxID=3108500 RepID=UPI00300AC490